MPKFRPDLSARLRDISEKTGPREAETDSKCDQDVPGDQEGAERPE